VRRVDKWFVAGRGVGRSVASLVVLGVGSGNDCETMSRNLDAMDGVGAARLSVSRSSGVIRQSGQSTTKRLCDLHDPPANAADGLFDYEFKRSTNGTVAVTVRNVWFGVYESYGMIAVRV